MLRIIILEDEEIIRRGLVYTIDWQQIGCCVVGDAGDGRTGLELIEKTQPDVVLTDIRMPRLDGLESARAIRNLPRDDARTVPIIAMTANAFEEDRSLAYEAGMTGYLTKPVDPQQLFDELEKL